MSDPHLLEFPSGFFDLVNMHLAQGWMRAWDWPKLLQEAQRVSKPEAIRFTASWDMLTVWGNRGY